MIPASFVNSTAQMRIGAVLAEIEQAHGIEILVAAESGSRAWGFPSADSDYDVRILYRRPSEDYLSILPKRDVIELPMVFDQTLGADLDVNGWDIQKALYLALQSNTALLEWLNSPIHYIRHDQAADRLLRFVESTANLDWLAYRYDRPARHALDEILGSPETVRLKRYFYALRPALAYRWILERRQPPPMDLASLTAGLSMPSGVMAEIETMVALKAMNAESFTVPRNGILDDYLTAMLSTKAIKTSDVEIPAGAVESANALFRELLT